MMQFAATFALSVIPLAIAGAYTLSRSAPVTPVTVRTESVRMIALDTRTFEQRWPVNALPQDIRVRTTRIAAEIPGLPGEAERSRVPPARPAVDENAASPSPLPARIVRRVALRRDICSRHGRRKVEYLVRGYKHWRCRR
jgi:hypothetical protein